MGSVINCAHVQDRISDVHMYGKAPQGGDYPLAASSQSFETCYNDIVRSANERRFLEITLTVSAHTCAMDPKGPE